jgi:chorismate-pyruvate lyase
MKIELSAYDKEFVINLLQNTSVQRILDHLQSSSTVHPENEDFIECELKIDELGELIGELSYEANHNRKKLVAKQACDIAESLENQLWDAKHAQ